MFDQLVIWRELSLAAFGLPLDSTEPWVIDRFTSALEERHVRRGQKLFAAGEVPGFVYFMQEGDVRMEREGSPAWTFRGRWVLGSFDAHLDHASRRDAVALSDLYVLRIRTDAWLDLQEDSFALARQSLLNAAATVARIEDRLPRVEPQPSNASGAACLPAGSLGLVERLAFLTECRLLRGAGVQTLADLAMAARQETFATGDVVLARDVDRHHLVLVVDGAVHADKREPPVARDYGARDLVGGAACFGKPARGWEAVAAAPTRVLRIPIEAWFDLMEDHFDLVRSAFGVLAGRREWLLERLAAETDDLVLT